MALRSQQASPSLVMYSGRVMVIYILGSRKLGRGEDVISTGINHAVATLIEKYPEEAGAILQFVAEEQKAYNKNISASTDFLMGLTPEFIKSSG